jgi:hypothetical protein
VRSAGKGKRKESKEFEGEPGTFAVWLLLLLVLLELLGLLFGEIGFDPRE